MKHLILAISLIVGTGSTFHSAHAQWAVIDSSVLAKSIEQLQQMKQQYDVLQQQYAEMMATKEAVTGSYGAGLLENGIEAQESRRILPGTWQDVVNQQSTGDLPGLFGQKQEYYKNLLPTVDTKLFSANPNNRNLVSYKLATDNTQASFSATEAVYDSIQNRLQTIESLTKEIDKTTNVKNATDLNSRIAAENGFLNLDMARLSALQLSLQTVLQNGQNQSHANHAEFFGTPMP